MPAGGSRNDLQIAFARAGMVTRIEDGTFVRDAKKIATPIHKAGFDVKVPASEDVAICVRSKKSIVPKIVAPLRAGETHRVVMTTHGGSPLAAHATTGLGVGYAFSPRGYSGANVSFEVTSFGDGPFSLRTFSLLLGYQTF